MKYDMYVFTNRSVYPIVKSNVKKGLVTTQKILVVQESEIAIKIKSWNTKSVIDAYKQQNFYQLGTLLSCKPGTWPRALCLCLSTSLLVLLDCITDAA
jgi:hypothetical protein